MNQKTFNPTSAQIQAAQKVFIAQAFYDVIAKAFDNIEKEILLNGNYQYDSKYYTEKWADRIELPRDRFIRNPKSAYMMAGLTEYCNDNSIVNDCSRYYSELERRTQSAGMINGQNSKCMADNDLRKAQNELLIETFNIHGCDLDLINMNMDNRKKMIDLLMGLFSKLVSRHIDPVKRKYFDERIRQIAA